MNKYENIVQGAVERLLEDERLRSSLSDDEANLLVNWAIRWLEQRVSTARDEVAARQIVQTEIARLRPCMSKVNDLLADDRAPTLAHAAKAFGLSAPNAAASGILDRKALIQALTTGLAQEWSKA